MCFTVVWPSAPGWVPSKMLPKVRGTGTTRRKVFWVVVASSGSQGPMTRARIPAGYNLLRLT